MLSAASSIVAGWFRRRSERAKTLGGRKKTADLRVVLLEGYALSRGGGKLPKDDPVLAIAHADPSPKVKKRARDLAKP